MNKILIIDDHKVVRVGIAFYVNEVLENVEIQEASNKIEIKNKLDTDQYQMIISDIKIPNFDILETLKVYIQKYPNVNILITSMNSELSHALFYLQIGCKGYIEKGESEEIFKEAIRRVFNGQLHFSTEVMKLIVGKSTNKNVTLSLEKLSVREFQIAESLYNGMSLKEIGVKIGLKPSTVSTLKMRVFEKLNIDTLNELIEIFNRYSNLG